MSDSNPLVSRLMEVRNQYLAHRQASLVSRGTFASLPELSRTDIEKLLNAAYEIGSKYCHLYGRKMLLSPRLFGADDYKHLLALLTLGLQSIEARRIAENNRLMSQILAEPTNSTT
jgi:hypothetical protein